MTRLDVQADLRRRISEALPGVEVATSVPPDRPAELIVVRREGGRALNATQDAPGVGIDAWAATEARAYELCRAAGDAVRALTFADGYERVAEEAMCTQHDPLLGSPHWYASYSLVTHNPKV